MAGEAHYALALTAGTVAAFNPCGFAMLPAYLSLFIGTADDGLSRMTAIGRALAATAAMTAGFVAVFGSFAFLVRGLAVSLEPEWLSWATVVIGIGLIGLGIALVAGREIFVRVPKVSLGKPGRTAVSMGLYGVTYAVASLSCTIGPFLTFVTLAFRNEATVAGIGVFLAYALGMGLVVGALSVAAALARGSLVGWLRRGQRYVGHVSGGLLVVAGFYVTWYGWSDLRLVSGDVDDDPVVDRALGIQETLTGWVDAIGGWGFAGILAALIVAALLVRSRSRVRS